MSHPTYSPAVQVMIDRAASLTATETDSLGTLWENDEELVLPGVPAYDQLLGELDYPIVTNKALIAAWQSALDAAGTAGRVDEIEAARAAGRAATHDVRHLKDTEAAKNGAEEAVRSAVLAVGVRDLIADADYQTLVSPWQQVLGAI
jgi:hypothetical protein